MIKIKCSSNVENEIVKKLVDLFNDYYDFSVTYYKDCTDVEISTPDGVVTLCNEDYQLMKESFFDEV